MGKEFLASGAQQIHNTTTDENNNNGGYNRKYLL